MKLFNSFINECKSHFTSRFCKVKLNLKSNSNIVSKFILAKSFGLSDRYRTILTCKFHVQVKEFQREEGVLEISYQLKMSLSIIL